MNGLSDLAPATYAGLTELVESVRTAVAAVQQGKRDQAQLTATGYAANKRVSVVVDSRGVVQQTRFADDVDELSYTELAEAVTKAARDAAAQVRSQTEEIAARVRAANERLPQLSEVLPGFPDLVALSRAEAPGAAADNAREDGAHDMQFTDVTPPPQGRSGVAESSW